MTRTCQQAFNLDEEHCPGFKEICHEIITDMEAIYHVDIYSWVYMSNHYHLSLTVEKPERNTEDIRARYERLQEHLKKPKPWRKWYLKKYYKRFTDLSWYMWEINLRMAKAYNERHNTKGHFWGARFKSKVLEDEEAILRVCTYIEQNPVKAGICEVPSEYPYCSVGKAKQELENDEKAVPKTPAIGRFEKLEGRIRAWRYVQWMDYQTRVILGRETNVQPPVEIAEMIIPADKMEAWRKDFEKGGPVDWRTQSYGSQEFEAQIREEERAHQLKLAHEQYLESRKKKKG